MDKEPTGTGPIRLLVGWRYTKFWRNKNGN